MWPLGAIMVVASTYRIPLFDQLADVKVALFGFELIAALLLLWVIEQRRVALVWCLGLAMFIFLRTAIGVLNATLGLDQPLLYGLQESRFGLLLLTTPLAFFFLRDMPASCLRRYVMWYLSFLLAIDASLFALFVVQDLLVLGVRTDNRVFSSIVSPLLAVATNVVRKAPRTTRGMYFGLVAAAIMLLHAMLISTSRLETILSAGVLAFIASSQWPRLRRLIYFAVGIALLFATARTLELLNAGDVGGRDYTLALSLALDALPFGFGAATDTFLKATLDIPQAFFFSDYGMLSYVLRYGFLGLLMVAGLLLLWLAFAIRALYMPGGAILALSVLAYLLFVPLLDYATLTGGFVIAFIVLANKRISFPNR